MNRTNRVIKEMILKTINLIKIINNKKLLRKNHFLQNQTSLKVLINQTFKLLHSLDYRKQIHNFLKQNSLQ